jgi:hypothetical protein
LRRAARFTTGLLPTLVAIGSLGIAYVQYLEAADARLQQQRATSEAKATRTAANLAIRRVEQKLTPEKRKQLNAELSRIRKVPVLLNELEAQPSNVEARRDLLLWHAIKPQQRP